MDEYIERKKVAEILCKEICGEERGLCVSAPENCCQKKMLLLYELPASDVAPVVHGKWIFGKVEYGFSPLINGIVEFPNYTCSNCGYETGTQAKKFVCCPKCTAKMDL